jgi:hypothetical protein
MGGHSLSHDFVLSTRAYARAIVPVLSIRLLGVVVPVAAGGLLVEGLSAAARALSKIPEPVKALPIISALGALAHPGFRKRSAHGSVTRSQSQVVLYKRSLKS